MAEFLLQQILRCGPGRQTEAVKRLNWIHKQMADHPGSTRMIVGRYLGNATDMLILRQWKDRDAYDDFMKSPAGEFPKSKPPGLYDSLDISHNWELALRTPGYVEGGFIWRSGFRVLQSDWDSFIALRQWDDNLAQWYKLASQPGSAFGALVYAETFKSADDDQEALALVRLENREAMEDIVASPSRSAIDAQISHHATHPGNANAPRGPVYSDCFQVVDELVRP